MNISTEDVMAKNEQLHEYLKVDSSLVSAVKIASFYNLNKAFNDFERFSIGLKFMKILEHSANELDYFNQAKTHLER